MEFNYNNKGRITAGGRRFAILRELGTWDPVRGECSMRLGTHAHPAAANPRRSYRGWGRWCSK